MAKIEPVVIYERSSEICDSVLERLAVVAFGTGWYKIFFLVACCQTYVSLSRLIL